MKLATPKPAETPKPEESKETSKDSIRAEIPEAITTAAEEEVIKSVPKIYKTGARQLLDKIKENRNVLHWNDKRELIYENKAIPGSHLVNDDTLRHKRRTDHKRELIYENKAIPGSHLVNDDTLRHRKGFEPVGWPVFVRGLARMNVPENLVRNPQRQNVIR